MVLVGLQVLVEVRDLVVPQDLQVQVEVVVLQVRMEHQDLAVVQFIGKFRI